MGTRKKVTVILLPESDGGYTAFIPLFPSCTTQGETAEEAFQNARESIELLLEEPSEDDLEFLELSAVPHVVVGEVEVEAPDVAATASEAHAHATA